MWMWCECGYRNIHRVVKCKMSAIELIERLRNENLDQFFTLVRMHLSFIVDINTDE